MSGEGSNRALAVDDAIERVGFGFGQYLILANMGVSLLGEGMQLVVVFYLGDTLHDDLASSELAIAWVDTAILLGLGIGCFVGGAGSDMFGRKPTLQIANLLAAIFGVASAFVPNCWVLLAMRLLLGISMGAFIPASIALILETTPQDFRDTSAIAIPIALGATGKILVAALADLLHEESGKPYIHWRLLLFLCAIPDLLGLLLELLSVTIPSLHTVESPYWLLVHSQGAEASKQVRHLAEQNGAEDAFPEGTAIAIPEKEVKQDHEHHYVALARSAWAWPAAVGAVAQSCFAFAYFGLLFALPFHMERWVDDESMGWSEEEKDTALLVVSLAELPAALLAAFVLTRSRNWGDVAGPFVLTSNGESMLHGVVLWSGVGVVASCLLYGFSVVSLHPTTWILGFVSRGFASLTFETGAVWVAGVFPDRFRGTALSMVEGVPRLVAAFSPEAVLAMQPLSSPSSNSTFFGFQPAPTEPEFLLFGVLSLAGLCIILLLPAVVAAAGGSGEEEGEEERLLASEKEQDP